MKHTIRHHQSEDRAVATVLWGLVTFALLLAIGYGIYAFQNFDRMEKYDIGVGSSERALPSDNPTTIPSAE